MSKKLIASLMIATLLVSNTLYAQAPAAKNTTTNVAVTNNQKQDTKQIAEIKGTLLTLDEAISQGLENSLVLQQVRNQADIAKLVGSNGEEVRNNLNESTMALSHASYVINDGRDQIYEKQPQLESAQAALERGMSPATVSKEFQGVTFNFKAGNTIMDDVVDSLAAHVLPVYPGATMEQVRSLVKDKAEALYPTVVEALKQYVSGLSDELAVSQKKLEEGTQEYLSSKSQYDAAVQFAMSNVANKLSVSTISSLRVEPLGELVIKMVTAQDKVTAYAVNIYKNQVALLIENSYFEALKQQEILKVKDKAMERGLVQYELAKAAYKVGGKSKDDMLLAKSYYNSTVMARELQVKEYNSALIALKKNMNMDLSKEIHVAKVEASPDEEYDLAQGIASGLSHQLAIRKAEVQAELYDDLMVAVNASNYKSSDNQYKEVVLLQQGAKIAINQAKLQAESDIRTSHATVESMKKLVKTAAELRQDATENVEIAKVKYEVGYGFDNALLKQLNLQDMSGTIVEVIAAEENLTNIEEKEIEVVNGYNLSRLKYLNDIGILPY